MEESDGTYPRASVSSADTPLERRNSMTSDLQPVSTAIMSVFQRTKRKLKEESQQESKANVDDPYDECRYT